MRSDRDLEQHLTAINELQGLREAFRDVLLTSQRYLITGEKITVCRLQRVGGRGKATSFYA